MFRFPRASSLLAFGLSLSCTLSTAGAVDLDPGTHLAVPGDFNGDGRLDVLLQPLDAQGDTGILLQDGQGQLSVVAQGWNPGYLGLDWSVGASTVRTADLNGDGLDDVLVQPTAAGGTAAVLLTDPSVQLLKLSQLLPAGYLGLDWSSASHTIVAGDFDGDRHQELFLQAVQPKDSSAIVHADAAGHLVAVTQTFQDGDLGRHWNAADETLYVGDFNGDGRADLLVQSNRSIGGEAAYALILADANGNFTRVAQTWNLHDLGADWDPRTHAITLEDARHKGVMDIVLRSKTGGSNYLYEADAQGLFSQPTTHWTGTRSAADALNPASSSGSTAGTATRAPLATQAPLATRAPLAASGIAGPTSPEPNPVPRTGSGAQGVQGSGQIMTVNTVGSLPGHAGVSGGTATYSIPLAVPPGIAGMQPSLSLNYSSRGGNGEMGMGWSLGAGSQIHRCPATSIMDGYSSGVTYGATDRLCLDGQHLVLVSGTYGADGAVYRTELDSFARITESGAISSNSSSFTVQEKNGHTLNYGYGSNIGASANAVFTPSGAGAPLAWGLGMELDVINNSIIYYYSGFGAGEYLLTSIKYTGAGATAGNREVDFNYITRGDASTQYLAGGLTAQTMLLSSVTTRVNGTQVTAYSMQYGASATTGRTLLAGVQQCGGAASLVCLPETSFGWAAPALAFAAPQQYNLDLDAGMAQGQSAGNQPSMTGPGDFNGDGRRDLVYSRAGADAYVVMADNDANIQGTYDITAGNLFAGGGYLAVADINNDGASDLVGAITGSGGASWLAYATFVGMDTTQTGNNITFSAAQNLGIPATGRGGASALVAVEDVDGDGRPDVVVMVPDPSNGANDALQFYRNTSAGGAVSFAAPVTLYSAAAGSFAASPAGDMNGDGLPDFMIKSCGACGIAGILFSGEYANGTTGFSYVPAASLGLDHDSVLNTNNPSVQLDINGDGLPDYVFDCYGTTQLCYQLNTGGHFGPVVNTGVTDPLVLDSNTTGANLVGSFDNSGSQEILFPSQRLATYCVREQVQLEGVWQPNDVCVGGPTTAQLPDSQDFSIYSYNALKFVPQPNSNQPSGYLYVPAVITTGIVAQAHLSVAADVRGDGLTAVLSPFTKWFSNGEFQLSDGSYSNCPKPYNCGMSIIHSQSASDTGFNAAPDMMISAFDGYGSQSRWSYFPLSGTAKPNGVPLYQAPAVGSPGRYAGDDYFYFSSSMYVVGEFVSDNGVGGFDVHDFHYGQAIYNNQGRGFQGFRTVVDDDDATGARSVQLYHQRFPLSGMLQESWVTPQSPGFSLANPQVDANAIDHVVTQVACNVGQGAAWLNTPANGIYNVDGVNCNAIMDARTFFPFIAQSVETKSDLVTHSLLSTTTTTYCPQAANGVCASGTGYDLYGNLLGSTSVVTDAQGSYTGSVQNTYTNNAGTWWLGRLDQTVAATDANYGIDAGTVTRTTHYTYLPTRRVQLADAAADGQAANDIKTQYAYDAGGNVTSVTVSGSGAGALAARTTTTSYTPDYYFVASVTDALGHVTSTTADARFGTPLTVTDPNGVVTGYAYDNLGRKTSAQVTSPLPLPAQAIQYLPADANCAATSVATAWYTLTTQAGAPSQFTCYDSLGRALRTGHDSFAGSDPVQADTTYDNLGRVTKLTEPYFASHGALAYSTSVYYPDLLGRLKTHTDAKGVVSNYAYNDVAGSPYVPLVDDITTTTPSDPLNGGYSREDLETRNILGKLMSVMNAKGAPEQATTAYSYDSDGNPITITAADGSQISAHYDVLGHKTQVSDPDQGTTRYSYDVAGDLLTQTDAKNQTQTMTYDSGGRLLTKVAPEGTTTWCYDGLSYNGSVGSVGNCAGSVGNHALGKLSGVGQSWDDYAEGYNYDADGRASGSVELISGSYYSTATSYDSQGRIASVSYPASVADPAPTVSAGAAQAVAPGAAVTLTGTASTSSGLALNYQWQQTGGPAVTLSSPTALTTGFTAGTAPGTVYTFQLTASDGLASASASVTVTVPSVPAAPTLMNDNAGQSDSGNYLVYWNPVPPTGGPVYYHVFEAGGTATGLSTGWSEITPAGGTTATNFPVSHTNNGYYWYWYRVYATDASGSSAWSNLDAAHVVVRPAVPINVSCYPGHNITGNFTCGWSDTGPVVTGFFLYSSADGNYDDLVWENNGGTGATWSFSGKPAGLYYYVVRACNQNGSVNLCSDWAYTGERVLASGGGGGCRTCAKTNPTPAPAPVTYPQPKPTGPNRKQPVPAPSTAPKPTGATLVPASSTVPGPVGAVLPASAERYAATGAPASVRPRYAPPVYKAWADARKVAATGSAPAARLTVQYSYSSNGYLSDLTNALNPNESYWHLMVGSGSGTDAVTHDLYEFGMDARGNVRDALYGNNVVAHYSYAPASGFMAGVTGAYSGTPVQSLSYAWYETGNLAQRSSQSTATNPNTLSEAFTYDHHNRLVSSTVSNGAGIQPAVSYAYDSVGDITSRSDTGSYAYGTAAGPHAVTAITGTVNGITNPSYAYDADGNMTSRAGTTVVWNSDNQPTNISQDVNNNSAFAYGPDKHRYKQTALNAGVQETTVYTGGLEIVTKGTTTEYRHTLTAYGRPVVMVSLSNNGSGQPIVKKHYLLTDHLGSVDTIVDDTGTVSAQESFDAFGKRRSWSTWSGAPSAAEVQNDRTVSHRGFTQHEHLDSVNLVDMGGRIYEPAVGRFLSVDPIYQAPTNSQSVNPYSYVMNNPLSLVDPSGYCASAPDNENSSNTSVCGQGDNDAGSHEYSGHNGSQTGSHIGDGHTTGLVGGDAHELRQQHYDKGVAALGAALSHECKCDARVVAVGGSGDKSWAAIADGNGSNSRQTSADRPNTNPADIQGPNSRYNHNDWAAGNAIVGSPTSSGDSTGAPTAGLTFSMWAALHLGGDATIAAFQDSVNKAIVSAHSTLEKYASAMGIRGEWSPDDLYKIKFTVDFLAANDNASCNNGCVRGLTSGPYRTTTLYMAGILGTNATFAHLVGTIIHEFRHTTAGNIALQALDDKSGVGYSARRAETDAFSFEDAVMQYYK